MPLQERAGQWRRLGPEVGGDRSGNFFAVPPNLEFWGGRIGVLGGTHRFLGGTHRNACYNLYTARKHLHQRVICRWGVGGGSTHPNDPYDPPYSLANVE